MGNFDFTSIGHILFPTYNAKKYNDDTPPDNNNLDMVKTKLRTFCEKLFETLSVMSLKETFKGIDGSLFLGDKKLLMEKFDLFFQNLKPSVDTFSKFIDCILKKSADDTDDIRFEVQNYAEKVVWDKFVYMDLLTKFEDAKLTFLVEHKKELYYLFAIFNRFAKGAPEQHYPPVLNSQRADFIFKKLDKSETIFCKSKDDITFEKFLELFFSDEILTRVLSNVKALFNEYVKDLIKDELVTCRVVSMMNRHSVTSMKSSLYNMENCLFRN